MKSILVTGSKGQLGWEIEGLSYTHAFKGFRFFHTDIETLDITDKKSVKDFFFSNRVDYIINCAAYTSVDKAEEESEIAMKINAGGVAVLLEHASQQSSVFFQVSTDYVFDGKSCIPYLEDDMPNPATEYGRTKLEGEKVLSGYEKCIIIRTSWLYSEVGNNFPSTILRLADEKKTLRVVYDQVGTPTYARDLARAILEMILAVDRGTGRIPFGIYNYSNEGVCSWYDFARAILRISGKPAEIVPVETREFPRPAQRPSYSVLNKSKIKSVFQISIPHWEDSLMMCLSQMDNKNQEDDGQ